MINIWLSKNQYKLFLLWSKDNNIVKPYLKEWKNTKDVYDVQVVLSCDKDSPVFKELLNCPLSFVTIQIKDGITI